MANNQAGNLFLTVASNHSFTIISVVLGKKENPRKKTNYPEGMTQCCDRSLWLHQALKKPKAILQHSNLSYRQWV